MDLLIVLDTHRFVTRKLVYRGKMGKTSPVSKTLKEYSEAATVHGVGYVFSRSLPLADKVLWALITLSCLSLAVYWSVTAFGNWQENLVVTTLKDPAKSVASLNFPAVTICTSGLDMEAVKDRLMKDFASWKEEEGKTSVDKEEDKALLEEYMKVKFEIEEISSKNIFDIIKALSSPDPRKTMRSLSVLERAIACAQQGKSIVGDRRRRSATTASSQVFPFQHEGDVYTRVKVQSGRRMTRDVVEETCRNYGMRPFCRYNNKDKDKKCAQGNLPVQWGEKENIKENIEILRWMKCANKPSQCPELYDIFFYLTDSLQIVDPLPGQIEVTAMYGSSGVVQGKGGFNVDGANYTSTENRPLYAACVQEAGRTKILNLMPS